MVGTLHPENVDNLCYYLELRFKRLKTNNQLCQPFTQICNTVLDIFLTLLQMETRPSPGYSPCFCCCVPSRFPKGLLTSCIRLLPPHVLFPLHGPGFRGTRGWDVDAISPTQSFPLLAVCILRFLWSVIIKRNEKSVIVGPGRA